LSDKYQNTRIINKCGAKSSFLSVSFFPFLMDINF
jgi:hypothetical protein